MNGVGLVRTADLDEKIKLWLQWDRNEKTRTEIQTLYDDEDWAELGNRLHSRMTFGTAGLRGPMRAGFNSMNDLVIIQTAQGLCEYILEVYPTEAELKRGIVIGYDGRHNSRRFAELSACVMVNKGIKVWLFNKTIATPFIPFTVVQLKCLAGVVVTASHNPKEDNGYKVYWTNGPQIIPPHDSGIQKCIETHLAPLDSSWDTSILQESDLVHDPFDEIMNLYYDALLATIPREYLEINERSELQFVYTAMHGVGYPYIKRAFETFKLQPVLAVPEQRDPDPDFPTVKSPNPEEGLKSLELSIKKANDENISFVIANDPDADRMICAERCPDGKSWKVFNGNELGALLGWWAIKSFKKLNPDVALSNCYTLSSTVSSRILKTMGEAEGFNFEETLTGFKWMGNRAVELMEDGHQVVFAFEEAIGFMVSTMVLDKDGISAAAHLASLVCYLAKRAQSLSSQLHSIYMEYGYHSSLNSYYFCQDRPTIERIFRRIRNYEPGETPSYPRSLQGGQFKVKYVRDLTTGVDTSKPDGKATLPVSSSSEMITFTFEEGLVLTIRTSGTEPKLKYYAEMRAPPGVGDYNLNKELRNMVLAIVHDLLQPEKNNLGNTCD